MFRKCVCRFLVVAMMLACGVSLAGDELPDPDGTEADMSKPVQVFILLGQSNMLGFGKISGGDGSLENAVKNKGLYPYLVDDGGDWTVRKDVRNVRVMMHRGQMKLFNNEWMTINGNIGPEIGIGHHVGNAIDAPVLILKSCIGNRSLGWDLLPPGSEPYEFEGKTYPGFRGTPNDPKGNGEKVQGEWYAGKQYDDDIENAKKVLADLGKYYPGAKEYEVAGFFWWQGDKDMRNAAHASRYETNLEQLMVALRKDFDAPKALFVFASLGQTKQGSTRGDGKILDAMVAVSKRHKDEAATVYTHPLSKGGSSSGHYNKNAETYMNVGQAMGKAMVELLKGQGVGGKSTTTTKPKEKKNTRVPMTPRTKVMTIGAISEREITSMLNYLKMMQPKIQVGNNVLPGIKVHQFLEAVYKKNKAKVGSTDVFLTKIATKTGSGQVYYVIDQNGNKTMLKTWFKAYLAKLRTNR